MKNSGRWLGHRSESKKLYYFNPKNPIKKFDVYIDKNPKDTIPIKYKKVKDLQATIRKLERLYKTKKYPHKRIWQVGMIIYVRLRVLQSKKPKEFALAKRYFNFLRKRTKLNERDRYKFKFHSEMNSNLDSESH